MGIWGSGPAENDDAFDVFGAVRYVLDDAWQLLRGDDRTLDDSELALIDAVAGIVNAIGEEGISLQPDDANELSERWLEQLSDVAWDALTADFPRTRPPFADEAEVERWLRESGAKYEVWMWAAQFGDDRAAAWNASEGAETVLAIARATGVPDAVLCTVIARCMLDHCGPQSDEPYRTAARVLEDVVAGRAVDQGTIDAIAPRLPHDAHTRAVRNEASPRAKLLLAAEEIGAGMHAAAIGGVFIYERDIPELGVLLRCALDPLVEPKLRG